jgi:CRISPR-associated protein Cmr4
MFEAAGMIGLYAETPLHPGSGSTGEAVDLPVQRERHTEFPLIPGSTLKGVMRDAADSRFPGDSRIAEVFGPDVGAGDLHGGALAPTDARLLLFPVRSLEGVFVWVTCPFVLHRLERDAALARLTTLGIPGLSPPKGQAVVGKTSPLSDPLVIEEDEFVLRKDPQVSDGNPAGGGQTLANALRKLMPATPVYDYFRSRLDTHLAVISDHDFAELARHATEVVTRIKLGRGKTTGRGGNMWVEEFLPSDCLFYALLLAVKPRLGPGASPKLPTGQAVLEFIRRDVLGMAAGANDSVLQVGGDETVGRGWMRIQWLDGVAGGSGGTP